MTVVRDVLDGAFRLAGILGEGTNMTYKEYSDALYAMNTMIDSWSIDKYKVFAEQTLTFPLVAGQQLYQLGPGGDFNIPRPARVDMVSVNIPTGEAGVPVVEIPVNQLTVEGWQTLTPKGTPSVFPTDVWINYTSPTIEMHFWPIPTEVNSVVLYIWSLLPTYKNLTDIVTLPPGYVHALEFNLCLMLCPEYGRSPSPDVVKGAAQSLSALKNVNSKPRYMRCDKAILSGKGNWSIALASRGYVVD